MRSLKFIAVCLFVCMGCLEPYTPNVDATTINSLVVDGNIDASGNSTIKLSRAVPLLSGSNSPKETGATVSIKSSGGEVLNLTETEPGIYNSTNLPVDKQSTYILQIHTADGKSYESDLVQVHSTPAIDNVYFTVSPTGDGIDLRVDSKDTDPNATGFYAWECIETYEYRAQLFSRFKRVNGIPMLRHRGEFVDTCWNVLPIPITLTSTKKLNQNVISGHKLTTINKLSPKISRRYSILVRQRSISEDEYNYRLRLTESIDGQNSIFAEIPGAVVSNVHSLDDPHEAVLGYFRAQEIQEKRFFIARGSIPEELQVPLPPDICDLEATCPTLQAPGGPNTCIEIQLLSDSKIIIEAVEFRNSVYYLFSTSECGDCRVKGGSTTAPSYWF